MQITNKWSVLIAILCVLYKQFCSKKTQASKSCYFWPRFNLTLSDDVSSEGHVLTKQYWFFFQFKGLVRHLNEDKPVIFNRIFFVCMKILTGVYIQLYETVCNASNLRV